MRLDKLALGLMGLLVLGFVIATLVQRDTNAELRAQIASLSMAAAQAPRAGLSDQSQGTKKDESGFSAETLPTSERAELTRLRAEVAQLKTQTQNLARVVGQPSPAASLNLTPASGWKNAGKDTPIAAAESFMWAASSGELDVLAKSIVLDPAARERAAEILARLPEASRALYDTPEKLIALFLAREGDARAMQILGESTAGNDALVNMRLQKDDGKTKEEGYQFRRTSDGWRLVVPAKAVDKFGKKLTEDPKKK